MALIVKVFINDKCIIDTHAVRVMGKPGHVCFYQTDTNHVIPHHYDDGGAALAIKLLQIYEEGSSMDSPVIQEVLDLREQLKQAEADNRVLQNRLTEAKERLDAQRTKGAQRRENCINYFEGVLREEQEENNNLRNEIAKIKAVLETYEHFNGGTNTKEGT